MRLTMLKLIPLSHRRLRADLIMVFKIINKLIDIGASLILDLYVNNNRGPKIKIRKEKCKSKSAINWFSNRVTTPWNSLPSDITSSYSLHIFISKLDELNINTQFYDKFS